MADKPPSDEETQKWSQVVEIAAKLHDIPPSALRSGRRRTGVALNALRLAIHNAHRREGLSLRAIARTSGLRPSTLRYHLGAPDA